MSSISPCNRRVFLTRAFMVAVAGGLAYNRYSAEKARTSPKLERLPPGTISHFNSLAATDIRFKNLFRDSVFVGVQRGDIIVRSVDRMGELLDNFKAKANPGELLHAAIYLGGGRVFDLGYPGIEASGKNIERGLVEFLEGARGLDIMRFKNEDHTDQVVVELSDNRSKDGIEALINAYKIKIEPKPKEWGGERIRRRLAYFFGLGENPTQEVKEIAFSARDLHIARAVKRIPREISLDYFNSRQ